MKKRLLLAFVIVVLTAPWLPVVKDIFLGLLESEFFGFKVGAYVSIVALLGAYGLWKRWF